MTVGQRIKALRKLKNIQQNQLADYIHVSPSTMCRIETESTGVTLENICNIANVLEVTPQDILCDIFVYDPALKMSIAEEIRITAEKLPPQTQAEILVMLKSLRSYLSES